jgi:hypothetical protein
MAVAGFEESWGMVRFRGALTPEIYARGLRAAGGRLRWIAWSQAVIGLIGLASAHIDQPVTWGWAVFLVLFGVMLLCSPQMTVRQTFAAKRFINEPFSGEADGQGMRIQSAHGHADLPWALMQKVVLLPDIVVVYQSANLARILPREFFDDDASWEAFRSMAKVPLDAARATRSVIRTALLWLAIIVITIIVWFVVNR